jgi:hypothetical protein
MGLKIVIPTEYQRVNKISLRAMPHSRQPKEESLVNIYNIGGYSSLIQV